MKISKDLLKDLNYEKFPENDVLEVLFGILRVYSLHGMHFEQACEEKKSETISLSDRCTVAIAQSINEASKLLTGDVYTDDEEKWLSDKKANPPFLLIYFKESVSRELRGGYRQELDSYILTYDAFPEGKKEITDWENDDIPNIITSLTVSLSTLEKQVILIPIERSIFGTTKDGKTLFDLKLSGSASVYISSPKSAKEINTSLEKSKELLPALSKNISRNFYEALNEPDRMKQFLGYFQFIEKYTHSTFKSLNYTHDAKEVFNVPERINGPMSNFFENFFMDSKTLAKRFHWCTLIAWKDIEESDINCFLEAKKFRDKLSHGEYIDITKLPVEKIKTLSIKLLQAK